MDRRRHLKVLMLACLAGLAGLGSLLSQEPGGPRPGKVPGPRFGPEQARFRRLPQVSPEERSTFEENLQIWHNLSPEEQVTIRNVASARVHAEIDKAVQDSGLHLDQDQRELFTLRYRQERRKLERDLQRETAAERARRMPEILARLKTEFGGAPANGSAAAVRPAASPAAEAKPEATTAAPVSPAPAR